MAACGEPARSSRRRLSASGAERSARHAGGRELLPVVRLSAVTQNRIDAAVRAGMERGDFPGAVVAVGRRDGLVFRRSYGALAELPAREPALETGIYDLASLTKPVAPARARSPEVHYGDLGFVLLGAVVERAARARLDRFAAGAVFAPLGLTDTGFGARGPRVAPTANAGDGFLRGAPGLDALSGVPIRSPARARHAGVRSSRRRRALLHLSVHSARSDDRRGARGAALRGAGPAEPARWLAAGGPADGRASAELRESPAKWRAC